MKKYLTQKQARTSYNCIKDRFSGYEGLHRRKQLLINLVGLVKKGTEMRNTIETAIKNIDVEIEKLRLA